MKFARIWAVSSHVDWSSTMMFLNIRVDLIVLLRKSSISISTPSIWTGSLFRAEVSVPWFFIATTASFFISYSILSVNLMFYFLKLLIAFPFFPEIAMSWLAFLSTASIFIYKLLWLFVIVCSSAVTFLFWSRFWLSDKFL